MLARPGLPSFEYVKASTPAEVHSILQQNNAQLMMGGTDLFTQMRDGVWRPHVVVDVKHLPGMRDLAFGEQFGLRIGAAVTMNQLVQHPVVRSRYPTLAQAAKSVASFQLRNRATIGGNVCNASPCADTSPALVALEGAMILSGPDGGRRVPAADFFLGPGKTVIRAGEFLVAIHLPVPPAGSVGCYHKLGRCRSGDLSVVGVAALGFPDSAAAAGYRFRLASGSVAPIPVRVPAAEELLASEPPSEQLFAAAAQKMLEAATPISDVRATASYQKQMVRALTLRALRETWEQLQNQGGGS